MINYYKILEIPQRATLEEIKKSYRQLALKYHPDLNSEDELAENKFKQIAKAYEILSDFGKRKSYDSEFSFSNQKNHGNENNSNQKKELSSPLTFLNILQDIRQKIEFINDQQINYRNLYDSLSELLSESNIKLLQKWDDLNTNRLIIDEVLVCCKSLEYNNIIHNNYADDISSKLLKLAKTDKESVIKILNFKNNRKYWGYFDKYKGAAITSGIVLVILLVVFNGSFETPAPTNNATKDGDLNNTFDPRYFNKSKIGTKNRFINSSGLAKARHSEWTIS